MSIHDATSSALALAVVINYCSIPSRDRQLRRLSPFSYHFLRNQPLCETISAGPLPGSGRDKHSHPGSDARFLKLSVYECGHRNSSQELTLDANSQNFACFLDTVCSNRAPCYPGLNNGVTSPTSLSHFRTGKGMREPFKLGAEFQTLKSLPGASSFCFFFD